MHILAQLPAPSSPAAIGWFFVIAVSIIAGLNQGIALVARLKDKPSPGEVASDVQQRFVTRDQWQESAKVLATRIDQLDAHRITDAKDQALARKSLYQEVEAVRKEMGEMERRLNAADECRTAGLHTRINEVVVAVSELRGVVTGTPKPKS